MATLSVYSHDHQRLAYPSDIVIAWQLLLLCKGRTESAECFSSWCIITGIGFINTLITALIIEREARMPFSINLRISSSGSSIFADGNSLHHVKETHIIAAALISGGGRDIA